jgi:hypothetical protein
MAQQEGPDRIPYERALRVIGKHLDVEPAYHASVLEVPEGFTVRSQPVRHRTQDRIAQFDWSRLASLAVLHSAARQLSPRRQVHSGMWRHFPSGHEDFFRALGFTLDQEQARNISIDELPDGVCVSYMKPAGHEALFFEKCHRLYGPDEVDAMLRDAQRRRGNGSNLVSA